MASRRPDLSDVREVGGLLSWLEAAPTGTLVPATELAEAIRCLPAEPAPPEKASSKRDDALDLQLLTAGEVAEWLSVHRHRVYALARSGRLPSVRLGQRTIRFRRCDVETWLTKRS